MMYKLILLFFFTLQIAVAQNLDIIIIVKDFETDLPIEEVTITAVKTKHKQVRISSKYDSSLQL